MKKLDELELLRYEVASHWIPNLIWFDWGRKLLLKYFQRKARRKYKKYSRTIDGYNERKQIKPEIQNELYHYFPN